MTMRLHALLKSHAMLLLKAFAKASRLLRLPSLKISIIVALVILQQFVRYKFFLVKSTATSSASLPALLPYISSTKAADDVYNRLPAWLQEYAIWHSEQRRILNESNWQSQRYLIQKCLEIDNNCGGTSDRLRSLPLKLRLAAKMKRLLLIQWERPAKLEEFLVPPSRIDWTVPDWLASKLTYNESCFVMDYASMQVVDDDPHCHVMHTTYHYGFSGGAEQYNELRHDKDGTLEADFESAYRSIWMTLFQPTAPVIKLINDRMTELRLQPNLYNALHIRSRYSGEEQNMTDLVENATNCGLSFGANLPLYIATDSLTATRDAVDYASHYTRHARAHYNADAPPLHLNRGQFYLNGRNHYVKNRPDLYYDTFVDLYLLASAKCLAIGRGTYGYWANLMSADHKCVVRYFDPEAHEYAFPPTCRPPQRRIWSYRRGRGRGHG